MRSTSMPKRCVLYTDRAMLPYMRRWVKHFSFKTTIFSHIPSVRPSLKWQSIGPQTRHNQSAESTILNGSNNVQYACKKRNCLEQHTLPANNKFNLSKFVFGFSSISIIAALLTKRCTNSRVEILKYITFPVQWTLKIHTKY